MSTRQRSTLSRAGDMPVSYRTGDITSPYVAFREPLMVEDLHFIDCVRTLARPDTPGERGLDVVRVLARPTGRLRPVRFPSVDRFARRETGDLRRPGGLMIGRPPAGSLPRSGDQIGRLRDQLDVALKTVLSSERFVGGPEVEAFEAEFAEYCGVASCVGVGNGTDAMELVLAALGIGPGDEVIVPANTLSLRRRRCAPSGHCRVSSTCCPTRY